MKLTTKCEYACLALVELSRHYGQGLLKTDAIVECQGIPKKFLEQILLQLKTSGYVQSRRGAEGGWELACEPKEITLAEIIRLIDGALAPVDAVSKYFYRETPILRSEKLVCVFRDIRDYIAERLERTTFADLM